MFEARASEEALRMKAEAGIEHARIEPTNIKKEQIIVFFVSHAFIDPLRIISTIEIIHMFHVACIDGPSTLFYIFCIITLITVMTIFYVISRAPFALDHICVAMWLCLFLFMKEFPGFSIILLNVGDSFCVFFRGVLLICNMV